MHMSYSRSGIRSRGLVSNIYQKEKKVGGTQEGLRGGRGRCSKIKETPKEGSAVESAFMEICKYNKSTISA